MIELIYPYETDLPVIPHLTADTPAVSCPAGEYFPVVEPSGLVIGRSTRSWCHSGAKPLHPVIHIHIIDRYSRIYLQKRSLKKDIQPGKWDTAVGGHVDYGEGVYDALRREVREELGITDFEPDFLLSYTFESDRERELIYVFKALYDGEVTPSEELDGGRFWDIDEVRKAIGGSILTPNIEQEFLKLKEIIK